MAGRSFFWAGFFFGGVMENPLLHLYEKLNMRARCCKMSKLPSHIFGRLNGNESKKFNYHRF